jgi:hypothetical protein
MTSTRHRILTILGVVLLAFLGQDLFAGDKPVRKFTQIGKWATHSLDVDLTTKHELVDKDGDTLSGAVFRINATVPIPIGNGKFASSFVNAIIATCGQDGITLVDSIAYDSKGVEIKHSTEFMQIEDKKQPSSPTTEAYAFLCKGVKGNTPKKSYTPGGA